MAYNNTNSDGSGRRSHTPRRPDSGFTTAAHLYQQQQAQAPGGGSNGGAAMANIANALTGIQTLLAQQQVQINNQQQQSVHVAQAIEGLKDVGKLSSRQYAENLEYDFSSLPSDLRAVLLKEKTALNKRLERLRLHLGNKKEHEQYPRRLIPAAKSLAELKFQIAEDDLIETDAMNIAVQLEALRSGYAQSYMDFYRQAKEHSINVCKKLTTYDHFRTLMMKQANNFIFAFFISQEHADWYLRTVEAWIVDTHASVVVKHSTALQSSKRLQAKNDATTAEAEARLSALDQHNLEIAEKLIAKGYRPKKRNDASHPSNPLDSKPIYLFDKEYPGLLLRDAATVQEFFGIKLTSDKSLVSRHMNKPAKTRTNTNTKPSTTPRRVNRPNSGGAASSDSKVRSRSSSRTSFLSAKSRSKSRGSSKGSRSSFKSNNSFKSHSSKRSSKNSSRNSSRKSSRRSNASSRKSSKSSNHSKSSRRQQRGRSATPAPVFRVARRRPRKG